MAFTTTRGDCPVFPGAFRYRSLSRYHAPRACEPFKMLKPEHYELWKSLEISFNPRDLH